jgi:hypothetical protein
MAARTKKTKRPDPSGNHAASGSHGFFVPHSANHAATVVTLDALFMPSRFYLNAVRREFHTFALGDGPSSFVRFHAGNSYPQKNIASISDFSCKVRGRRG